MLTTTSVIDRQDQVLADVERSPSSGLAAKYAQYASLPNGGEHAGLGHAAGRAAMFRPGPLKTKISMMPSQNVGMAKPT